MLQILAATKNKHKINEIKELIDHPEIEILSLEDIDEFPDVIEDGNTFEENAEKKALSASNHAGIPAFADDSGLVVEALDGAPGVISARYAGLDATDEENTAKLLKQLENCENRNAKFVCVIAIANEGDIVGSFTGEVKGKIGFEPKGSHGFGYDPVFIPDGYNETFAELGNEVKDKISHRAKAIQEAVEFVEDAMSINI